MISFNKYLVLAVLGSIAAVSAGCPKDVPRALDLDYSKYSGMWHSTARIKGAPYQTGNCEQVRYKLLDAKYGTISIFNSLYNPKLDTIDYVSTKANCTQGYCDISFFPGRSDRLDVLATDYTNYAVTYNCKDVEGKPEFFASVLTRSREPAKLKYWTALGLSVLESAVPAFPIDNMLLNNHDASKCFYLGQKRARNIFGPASRQ